ncbi:MAG TPA: hypothetical protein VNU68_07225 [Verrucomicrobiae bacterium]|nr:hypothetical protein [Verrucomicrobiae bacterium]
MQACKTKITQPRAVADAPSSHWRMVADALEQSDDVNAFMRAVSNLYPDSAHQHSVQPIMRDGLQFGKREHTSTAQLLNASIIRDYRDVLRGERFGRILVSLVALAYLAIAGIVAYTDLYR